MANFDIVKSLKRVRRIVNNGWCKGADARSAKGVAVPIDSSTAKGYDLEAACTKAVYGKYREADAIKTVLYEELRAGTAFESLTDFNDNPATKRADVIKLINSALTRATPAPTVA